MKRIVLCLSACLIAAPPCLAGPETKKVIDPYKIPRLKDAAGKQWDLREDGSVNDGTSDCFDGALDLSVRGKRLRYTYQSFAQRQRRGMRLPGGAKQLWHQLGSNYLYGPIDVVGLTLRHERWVGLTEDKKWLRYIEIFENTGTAELDLGFELRLDFGSAIRKVDTSTGGDFGPKDFALCYRQQNGRPHVVRVLRGPRQKGFGFSQNLRGDVVQEQFGHFKIPAGKKVAILHLVAQLDDSAEIKRRLQKINGWEVLKGVPTNIRKLLINFRAGASSGGLSVTREEAADLIVLRSEKELHGSLVEKSLTVTGVAGEITVPASDMVGLELLDPDSLRVRIGCRDGQIFAGTLSNAFIGFRLSGGQELKVKASKIRSLGLRSDKDEERAKAVVRPKMVMELRSGDSLGVDDLGAPLDLVTRHGRLKLRLQDLARLNLEDEDNWGHRVLLAQGGRLGCLLLNGQLECLLSKDKGKAGVKPVVIRRDLIRSIHLAAEEPPEARPQPGQFSLELRNGDSLVAGMVPAGLELESEFGKIALKVRDIRRLSFQTSGVVEIKLWEGSQLTGRLSLHSFEMQVGKLSLKVSTSLIAGMTQMSFQLPEKLEAAVVKLVEQLDAADFEERDRGEATLKRLGPVVRSYLESAQAAKDASPEKKLRITTILKDIGSLAEGADINVAALRKKLDDSKDDGQRQARGVVRTLKAIHAAQGLFREEDRDKNERLDFGSLELLAKHVGKKHGISEELVTKGKLGYDFACGPSSNKRMSEFLWWGTATPKDGKGASFFVNHSGTVFVSKKPMVFDKQTCDPPASAVRYAE